MNLKRGEKSRQIIEIVNKTIINKTFSYNDIVKSCMDYNISALTIRNVLDLLVQSKHLKKTSIKEEYKRLKDVNPLAVSNGVMLKPETLELAKSKGFRVSFFIHNQAAITQEALHKWLRDIHSMFISPTILHGGWSASIFTVELPQGRKEDEKTNPNIDFLDEWNSSYMAGIDGEYSEYDNYEEAMEYGLITALNYLPDVKKNTGIKKS